MKAVTGWLIAITAGIFALVVGQYVHEYYYGKFWKLPIIK